MTLIRSICVYCGSAAGNDPLFTESARDFGTRMAAASVGLVYGGGNVGLMGTVAKAVLDGGGEVTGIIPEFLKKKERILSDVQNLIVTEDMHQRKQLMFEKADAFVALPGGVGTLEELIEMLTWAQLGRHHKPVLIANIAGFWKPLLVLLAHMRESGFIRTGFEVHTLVAEKIVDILPMLEAAAARRGQADAEHIAF
jgi:uncharacterized protein (TIGR00730 family)